MRLFGSHGPSQGPWAVVLAGGQGTRLRRLTRRIHGASRPKQFAAIAGARSPLGETLDRVGAGIPAARTIVVTQADHRDHVHRELRGREGLRLIEQPADRGTAVATLLPAHWILARDAEATVVVLPSGHFIGESKLFMAYVSAVMAVVDAHPEWVVLVGAPADRAGAEYDWIEPAETRTGCVWKVARYWRNLSEEEAAECLARGCLRNTFVLVARAVTLVRLGARCLPDVDAELRALAPILGTPEEGRGLEQAYDRLPTATLSADVLAPCPPGLMVSRLPAGVTWSDLATRRRVFRLLRAGTIAPPWYRPPLSASQTGNGT
jgi:mannose-1-phosphate guanylyltransferase